MPRSMSITTKLLISAYQNARAMLVVNASTAIGVAVILEMHDQHWVHGWVIAQLLMTGIRLIDVVQFSRKARHPETLSDHDIARYRERFAIGLYLSGLLWMYLSTRGVLIDNMSAKFTVVLIVSALAGGATGVTAPLLREGRFYIISLLLPPALFFLMGSREEMILGVLGLVFLVVMIIGHKSNHRILRHSFELQIKNDELVDHLRHLNAGLEDKVADRTRALELLANRDSLTSLPNRRALLQWMSDRLDPGDPREAAILFLDLDRFKQINDAMGHDIGDRILRTVANSLRSVLPDSAILARWGGDEFVVVTTQRDDIRTLADEIGKAMIAAVESVRLNDQTAGLGMSIGRSFYPTDADSFSEAIHLADLAVAEVKRHARGTLIDFDKPFQDLQKRRFDMARALSDAITLGELGLAFQPLVDSRSGQVVSYEALARWTHPVLGPVAPDEFIALAEETDLIHRLGSHVLDQACKAAAEWRADGIDAKVAVNVSVRQLQQPYFAAHVASTLARFSLSPKALQIEVTESLFDPDSSEKVLSTVRALRDLGIDIEIDDFGTGYSSLSRLLRFPVNGIKIDKSFVRTMESGGLVIIESAIKIARQFGFSVTVEGVETEEQAQILASLGVDTFQGYHFSRPVAHVASDHYPVTWIHSSDDTRKMLAG